MSNVSVNMVASSESREARIARIKAEIAADTYETPEKWAAALEAWWESTMHPGKTCDHSSTGFEPLDD